MKQHFSDLDQKELTWLLWTTIALTPFLIALFGLRQRPVFQASVVAREEQPDDSESTPARYEKSALSDEQRERIVARLGRAMEVDRLYQRPGASA